MSSPIIHKSQFERVFWFPPFHVFLFATVRPCVVCSSSVSLFTLTQLLSHDTGHHYRGLPTGDPSVQKSLSEFPERTKSYCGETLRASEVFFSYTITNSPI
ncbi:MAG: hypothetical protein ACXAC8_05855 [Candidatus Hodarchaeales archaeon]